MHANDDDSRSEIPIKCLEYIYEKGARFESTAHFEILSTGAVSSPFEENGDGVEKSFAKHP